MVTSTPSVGRATESVVVDTRRSPEARLRPVGLRAVRLDDAFWAPRLRMVRGVTLRQQYEQCERTGRIDNFRRAAGKQQGEFQGRYYNDSDVYKWLEAACFALAGADDPELAQLVERVVQEIAVAQSADGYLNTYFAFEREAERWTDLTTKHEMYCAGHFIQAAIAHHRVTGQRTALDVAIRLADHICATFGPHARAGTDGHEEIELAMVELYRETGDRRYLDEAGFLLDQRGQQPPVLSGLPYHQDHLPVRQQHEIVGHAVRATYLACGMADVVAETGDAGLRDALDHLWQSAFWRKAYLTGGLGAHWAGEAFGSDYELPSERAYAETCAAIGGFMWNWRMLALTGEARYADWMERALYNGILSGLSLDGKEYFYQNPLADEGQHRRQPWFGTACCPPNIARLLLALPGYQYSTSDEGLWVHLYAAGGVRVGEGSGIRGQGSGGQGDKGSGGGAGVALRVETGYPWEGVVRLHVEEAPAVAWSLFLRIPGWCARPALTVNGAAVAGALQPGSYAEVRREWRTGDVVELALPMPVQRVVAHPRIAATTGRVALMRGPLVYCLEGVDHPGVDLRDVVLPPGAAFETQWEDDLLDGIVTLRGEGVKMATSDWDRGLYQFAGAAAQAEAGRQRAVPLTAVPYYAWANRASGQMQAWLRAGT